jgi:hypothetical protein
MIVNRENYEEYFILYLDNELDAAGRREVEDFIARNPDLKEELDLLGQFRLSPDQDIVFPGKSGLLKNESNKLVNADNYNEWLLLYTDNELTADQKKEVELFIQNHPAVQKELAGYLQAKLIPETLVYPGKENLYRREVTVRQVYWWRIAAAAILVLATGAFFLSRMNKGGTESSPVEMAVTKQPDPSGQKPLITKTPADKQPVVRVKEIEDNTAIASRVNNKINPVEKIKKSNEPVIENNLRSVIASHEIKTNNLPQPEYNSNAKGQETEVVSLNKNPIVIPDEFKSNQNVTPGITYTSNNETRTTGNEEVFNDEGGKKNKLRGLLRKVTRTFEKTTNISATDDEDRLLIGGVAIKLK